MSVNITFILHAVIVSMKLTRSYKNNIFPPFSIFYAIYKKVLTEQR